MSRRELPYQIAVNVWTLRCVRRFYKNQTNSGFSIQTKSFQTNLQRFSRKQNSTSWKLVACNHGLKGAFPPWILKF